MANIFMNMIQGGGRSAWNGAMSNDTQTVTVRVIRDHAG